MKIIQLTCENVKKLTCVEITPEGNLVQITGRNGQGKSSVLDSIWWALTGAENIQSQPIRKGADKARIELKLGTGQKVECIVERRFSDKASYLDVKTPEGAKWPKPQNFLNDLLGSLTFDPLEFMRQGAKDQFQVLRKLVDIGVDLDILALDDAKDYAARTEVNRDAKSKRTQAEAITVADGLPDVPIDEAALLDKMQTAADHNSEIERRKNARATASETITSSREQAQSIEDGTAQIVADIERDRDERLQDIEKQISELKTRATALTDRAGADIDAAKQKRGDDAAKLRSAAAELETKLSAAGELPEPIDISDLRVRIETAKGTNAAIASRARRLALESEAGALEAKSAALTAAMKARDEQRQAAIASAKMPVPGLSFGDNAVTFNDLPLDQASDAEQLTVSTAIAAALNPKLRVIRIRDGSLLDDDAMKRLAEFADKNDMQIWIERVDGSGTVGVVMEDGHVKGHEPPRPTEMDAVTDTICAALSEAQHLPDLEKARADGIAQLKATEATDEDRAPHLGRLNTAYLERKRVLDRSKSKSRAA